jgi:hypothetical protein
MISINDHDFDQREYIHLIHDDHDFPTHDVVTDIHDPTLHHVNNWINDSNFPEHQVGYHDNLFDVNGDMADHYMHEEPVGYHDGLFKIWSDDSHIIGEPDNDGTYWQQQGYPDTCAIKSQGFILERFIGHKIPEKDLVKLAEDEGYYEPGHGTMINDVGQILEHYGIPVEQTYNNALDDLIDKLQHNQKIIVGVDANEIWTNSPLEQLKDLIFPPEANHAVEVIGYDTENQKVILNDPGYPYGKELPVPLSDFKEAWQDSDNFMMFTQDSAPPFSA